ncbi:MAG: tripartite tricarboxylate transporter substrate binding protein [Chloroflexota bacterium]
MDSLNRRQFIRLLAIGSGGALLTACQSAAPATTPTKAPAATTAPAATKAAAATAATQAPAGAFKPTRPVTVICPWAAGGGTDAVARIFGTLLEKDLGQPFNVVNRTGGGGATGHTAGATADPDGYTFTLVTVEIAMMHWQKLADVDYKGFTPIAQVNIDPASVMVAATAKWGTLKELLDEAKASPGKLKASGTGKGGIWDLARAGMLKGAGIPVEAIPWVPSEGAAPGLQELVAGGVAVVTASLPEGRSLIDAKKVKALALMGEKRADLSPDVPTLKELGINWAIGAWRGFALPKGAKPEVVSFYEAAIKKAYDSKEYKDFMANRGYGLVWRSAKEFGTFMAQEDESMGKVMKDAGII